MTAIESQRKFAMTWTTERVALLKNCVNAGLSCGQIADEIGVSATPLSAKSTASAYRAAGAQPVRTRGGVPIRPPRLHPASGVSIAVRIGARRRGSGKCGAVLATRPRARQLSLADRRRGHSDFTFCGNTAAAGMSYCAGHARMAYRLSAKRARLVSSAR